MTGLNAEILRFMDLGLTDDEILAQYGLEPQNGIIECKSKGWAITIVLSIDSARQEWKRLAAVKPSTTPIEKQQ